MQRDGADGAALVPLPAREGMRSARASALWAMLALVVAVLELVDVVPEHRPAPLLVAAGAVSLVALVSASVNLHARPTRSWVASARDPYLAFAGALLFLLVPCVAALIDAGQLADLLDSHPWVTGAPAAMLAATGFSIVLRDLTPGRVLDALYLAVIGATTVGLLAWVACSRALAGQVVTDRAVLEALGPVVLDAAVIGLGLQTNRLRARGRHGCRLFLFAWTFVLVADVGALMVLSDLGRPPDELLTAARLLGVALLGAAALHPDTTRVRERALDPLDRMPRPRVVLLGGAAVLGPLLVGTGVSEPASLRLVVTVSVVLSLLVVVYLVHLVQGRAVFEHRAHHDELTGLANRTLFEDRATVAIAHARRTGGHGAVLFLDLDRFKTVNDSLGHAVGNLLLQAVATRLHGAARAQDTVARLGGDEFVVLLSELERPDEAATLASQILAQFAQPFSLNGHRVFASPSIGIAVFPNDGQDADDLLKNADTAMYRAKQRGRRTFCAYDRSMNDHAHERLVLENRLHTAVERGELRLHYQPKIHLPTGRVMGMEALLRWEHPDLGLLEPAAFIGLAEESGLIVPIGEWALEEACRQNQQWSRAGFGSLVVAVNMSLRQFQQRNIEDVTARVLRATGLDPELLELEVTESLAMQDPVAVRTTLLEIREMGVKCSIDDFGTGYSGLSHLSHFPIDKLKIDKAFVATIDNDREAPIVTAVVALAHGLGLEVVAEGVETTGQLERLHELHCDEMQGYLFSRPVPPEQFEQLMMLEAVSPGPGRLSATVPERPRLVRVAG